MNLDFVCIGAQKSGTTKLHDVLRLHDSVILPEEKEAHFFEIEERFEKGLNYFFDSFYKEKGECDRILGLVDPNLQLDLLYIKRIIEAFPEVKILFIMRNPVDRAYSHYRMSYLRGIEQLDFTNALLNEESRINFPLDSHKGYKTKEKGHFEKNHFGYINRGLYYNIIDFLTKNVLPDNFKIILFEDFVSDINNGVNEICEFLEIPNFKEDVSLNKSNQAKEEKIKGLNSFIRNSFIIRTFKKAIPLEIRRRLKLFLTKLNSKDTSKHDGLSLNEKSNIYHKYFKEEIHKIEKDFGFDLTNWKY